jgi:two-component system, sensor histidine kinase and response regulator
MEISHQRILRLPGKITLPHPKRIPHSLKKNVLNLMSYVKTLGYSYALGQYELLKLGVFNQLNFFQFLAGILIFCTSFFQHKFPGWVCIIAGMPALINLVVLYLNKRYLHQAALITYFILQPVVTSFIFMNSINLGLDLYFILYGILAVFFLKDIGLMIFSICFSMVNFFILSVVLKQFIYQLEIINNFLYLVNEGVTIVFIFYGLYLIKKENTVYQASMLDKNNDLQQKNVQIQLQADKIKENASLLEKQTQELTELNALKNKLFSIISHDLKAPMYAMRNFFGEVQQNNIPARELKKMIPGVVNDLTYTTSLMDNLLQWSKAQMQSDAVYPQKVDIGNSIAETIQLLNRQSSVKQIRIETDTAEGVFGFMDKDMLSLVLRNLISNAIKFTPEKGNIKIGVHENCSIVEVFVQDSGTGISPQALKKINGDGFYSTKGTANESGTGLGLKLCKEFMARNGGQLYIESKLGEGSTFSFSLPKAV